MFVFEGMAVAFFGVMLAVALWRRQAKAAVRAAALMAVIVAASRLDAVAARAWLAHAYLAFGYWIPAWLTTASSSPRFEAWLERTDARWRRVAAAAPAVVVALGDLAYVLCYPLVPFAFAAVWVSGGVEDVDRFWTSVLVAAFLCYGTLPWLVSRPPRLLDGAARAAGRLARGNAWVLSRISHQRNTFPSGHVAVSVAASLSVFSVWPAAGVACAVVAAGVAVGAVTGRYHYVTDVLAGLVVGIAAGLLIY